jgi:hypothetical protein
LRIIRGTLTTGGGPMNPATLARTPGALEQCAEDCARTFELCTGTATHCLERGGRHAEAVHVNLLLDCAEICRTGEAVLRRGTDRYGIICRACAQICRACAADCERLSGGDRVMDECAAQCRRCADSCDEAMT